MGLIDVMMCPRRGWCGWHFNHDRFGTKWGCHCHRVACLGQHQCRAFCMIFEDFEILKSCIYYVLKTYIYIVKRNTSGLWCRLGPALLEKVQASSKCFKRILLSIDQIGFMQLSYIMLSIILYILFYIMFSISLTLILVNFRLFLSSLSM